MDNFIFNLIIIIIGLIIGSFINVLSYRIPRNLPIIFSRSICPQCNVFIPLYRNIPIITYILQKGKCHNCNCFISILYPFIEVIIPVIFLLGVNNYQQSEYILFLWISSILITISIIDSKTLTIPLSLLFLILVGETFFLIFNFSEYTYMVTGLLFGVGYSATQCISAKTLFLFLKKICRHLFYICFSKG